MRSAVSCSTRNHKPNRWIPVFVCAIGLFVLIGCDTPNSNSGDNGGSGENAGTDPSGNGDQEPVACCMPDDTCVVMPFVDCAFSDGTFVDGVSSCDDDPCNTGACCNNGACVVTTEARCDDNYQGDATSCSSNVCRLGACCVEEDLGGCEDVDEDTCSSFSGGTWMGFDTACEPTKPCGGEPDHGACCSDDGACTITDETTCVLSDRSYAGDGVDCSKGLCDTGACCGQDGNCTEAGRFGCFDDFAGIGTRCANNNPCADEGGACCLADGRCVDLNDESECESFDAGSTFVGPGSSCFGTICRGTAGACCVEDGGCVAVVNAEACDALTGLSGISSTFRGAGSTCILSNGDELCGGPLRGACCFSFGRCEFATEERCALLEDGVFIGQHISCSDFERLPDTCRTR